MKKLLLTTSIIAALALASAPASAHPYGGGWGGHGWDGGGCITMVGMEADGVRLSASESLVLASPELLLLLNYYGGYRSWHPPWRTG